MQNNFENPVSYPSSTLALSTSRFMSRVYGWMALGIAMSGLVAWQVAQNSELAMEIFQNRAILWTLIILQFGAVMTLTAAINRLSSAVAGLIYFAYAALTGVTMSFIFLVYTQGSIYSLFAITAFAFAGLSGFGYATKRDLGPVGSFCTMGLFGLIGYGILSMFFPSLMAGNANVVFSFIGLLIFSGLTAYDTQKVKALHHAGMEGTEEDRKGAVYGALILYLDFINLFLMILRLFGKRR
jgi:FtsH-binding integral membrane protein